MIAPEGSLRIDDNQCGNAAGAALAFPEKTLARSRTHSGQKEVSLPRHL